VGSGAVGERVAAWRDRGGPFDLVAALVLLAVDGSTGLDLAAIPAQDPVPPVPFGVWLTASAALALPLAARRRWPWAAAGVVLAGVVFIVLTHGSAASYHFAMVSTAVLVVALRLSAGRRAALAYALALAVVLVAGAPLTSPWMPAFLTYVAVGVVVGEVSARRRADQLDEQRRAGERAALEERVRIAREMHDVVTHAVSLMVVQAEGARLAVRREPELAERAMGTVADTGRQTLEELRGLVSALRGPDVETGAVGDLVGLAATMRAAGLSVALDPDRPRLPAGLRATGYRIVQEALTNCLRHAPAGAAVTVGVCAEGDRLRIAVVDDGGPDRLVPPVPSGGSGLAGMDERARAAGGELAAGPAERGGWRVEATLPLPAGSAR
jgi:signal transduction histidine kinase